MARAELMDYDKALELFEPVLGFEVHVELSTQTKMFSDAPNPAFAGNQGAPPNTQITPVDLGLPGSLPVVNETAVRYAISLGLALGCEIADSSRFARKNYFYPDLAKNYQISQFDEPIAFEGTVDIELEDGTVFTIPIERAHMEEDAGKLTHVGGATGRIQGAEYSLVDYNRAGVPLVEIVTKPIFGTEHRAPEVGKAYVGMIRDIVRGLGISEAKMERGNLRCDANISLEPRKKLTPDAAAAPDPSATDTSSPLVEERPSADPANSLVEERASASEPASRNPVSGAVIEAGVRIPTGTRTETKNVNSLRSVERAVRYEIQRQAAILAKGGTITQETRHWHEDTGTTSAGRPKSNSDDYRYFPEPDLLPVEPSPALIAELRAALPESPLLRRNRLKDDWGFTDAEFRDVVNGGLLIEVEDTIAAGAAPSQARKWWTGEISRIANSRGVEATTLVSPLHVSEIVTLVETGELTDRLARQVLEGVIDGEGRPSDVVKARGLAVVSDDGPLLAAIDEAFAAQPDVLEKIRDGKVQAAGAIIGAVMKAMRGTADAARVRELVLERARK